MAILLVPKSGANCQPITRPSRSRTALLSLLRSCKW
uniref:Uncharacterized protein n=1 Tax=Phage sp. ctcqm2 TaxID=2828007 RepID=A0A8S5STB3_9VIRU|nr:MAG TPA: hypothetical protein [Phage sp. ctcqm2]